MFESHPLPMWAVAVIVITPIAVLAFVHPRTTVPLAACLGVSAALMLLGYAGAFGQLAMAQGSPLGLYAFHRLLRPREGARRRPDALFIVAMAATAAIALAMPLLPGDIVRNP